MFACWFSLSYKDGKESYVHLTKTVARAGGSSVIESVLTLERPCISSPAQKWEAERWLNWVRKNPSDVNTTKSGSQVFPAPCLYHQQMSFIDTMNDCRHHERIQSWENPKVSFYTIITFVFILSLLWLNTGGRGTEGSRGLEGRRGLTTVSIVWSPGRA